jgi:hypothetical protein
MQKIGRNDPCWCGSGRKYKFCHLRRAMEEPVPLQTGMSGVKRAFDAKYCLHPRAGVDCKGPIVRAHTIQRSGGLDRIAEGGKVGTFRYTDPFRKRVPESSPELIGIHEASTFTGFCSYHDCTAFAPVEQQPFQSTPKQAFLLWYRALCHELYLKKAQRETKPILSQMDKGRPLRDQIAIQGFVNPHMQGVDKCIQDLSELKGTGDQLLLRDDFSPVRYYTVVLRMAPEVLCAGIHQPEYDFSGNEIQSLGELSRPASFVSFTLTATDSGGAAVFCWLGDNTVASHLVSSLAALDDVSVPHAVVRYAFEFHENTYFSPEWWRSLGASSQKALAKRQFTEIPPVCEYPRESGCLLDDGIRVVDWHVVSRCTNAWSSSR